MKVVINEEKAKYFSAFIQQDRTRCLIKVPKDIIQLLDLKKGNVVYIAIEKEETKEI